MDYTFDSPPCKKMDDEALRMITNSLQGIEQLRLQMKKTSSNYSTQVSDKIRSTLDDLREIKSEIEGSNEGLSNISIHEQPLKELRQLTLMHVPISLNPEVKTKFENLILEAFKGEVQKILCVVLLTCPWYAASQRERGEQAKHNIILVIYLGFDHQFFTPANPHDQTEGKVIDLGWLQAVELSHFGHFLAKGRTRFVEAVLSEQCSVICDSEEWAALRHSVSSNNIMGLRGFVEACRGQAVGGISKKRKNGALKLKDTTTFYQLCESCRLLQHVERVLAGQPLCSDVAREQLSENGAKALDVLKSMYQEGGGTKQDFFPLLQSWKDELDTKLKGFKFCTVSDVETVVGRWMMDTRLQGRALKLLHCIEDERSTLTGLMQQIGGPVAKKDPNQILLIARAGSYMYGLSTPDSDVDYMVIYAEPCSVLLSACRQMGESVESRGPEKLFEYGAYEARLFSEMLIKASVVILELIFADNHEYMSPSWKSLVSHRGKFVTERGIQQYLGLVKNNFNLIDNEKHIGTGRDRKLFYQIFHKLESVRYMLRGECPPVRVGGQVREFIMRVRTQPLQGDLERSTLHKQAREEFKSLVSDLADRKHRLAEKTDYRLMLHWLQAVRGIS